ncbi:alpha/beta hydrolase [Sphaerimonospora thailandensis]|uniref:Alpha/beta hydrolase fold-3 domain-containing protein n=1 Tax=Sphaerimonospora thailandensis TaxID=795644 RepID=A0A8J3RDE7_9ACTN|nr:alpha/beta hydrolase [Sphaerimonospora thailandensis]GIH72585.1 hypothetical protein Mth01_48380 [Sphaerimonospora thailandensis]
MGGDGVRCADLAIDAGTHFIPIRIFQPEAGSGGLLVWAHGGSWITGSLDQWHGATTEFACVSGWTVISVGYRLAPQHRHPAQLDDVLAALAWAEANDDGESPLLAVGGDSAGGTIAACAALVRRDRGMPLAAQVLAYPPFDPQCRAPSYRRDPTAFPSAQLLRSAWQSYRGDSIPMERSGERLYATPLEAERLDDLPPAIIAVGELDPVIDDVTAYARALHEAGNDVTLQVFPDTFHAAFLSPYSDMRRWLGNALHDHISHQSSPQ